MRSVTLASARDEMLELRMLLLSADEGAFREVNYLAAATQSSQGDNLRPTLARGWRVVSRTGRNSR
ncbi:MAG: hypothetical protein NVS3B5_06430 [Sphingomicrobium sp.]